MLLPSPCLSVGVIAGTSSYNGTTFAGETKLAFASSPATMLSILNDFRVVGWGARIRNIQPPASAVGMLEIAQVPCGNHAPSWSALNTQSFTSSQLLCNNLVNSLTMNGSYFASLLNLPDSDEYAAQELMANDVLISGKICSPAYLEFRSTNIASSYNATYNTVQDGALIKLADGTVTTGTSWGVDPTQLDGRTAILLNLRGAPLAVTGCFDIEIIYHIEGTPATVATPVFTTGAGAQSVADPVGTARAVAALSRQPVAKMVSPQIVHHSGGFQADPVDVRLGMGAASRVAGRGLRLLQGPATNIARSVGKRALDEAVKYLLSRYSGKGKSQLLLTAPPVTERAIVPYRRR